jgi:glucose-6-phosphate dehydrogenase assembly protein OpcA
MNDQFERLRDGEELSVDLAGIERSLAELWRNEGEHSDDAVTKAALWNVVAHTDNDRDRSSATELLAQASASIPQRTIVIRAARGGEAELSSWISANCHLVGGSRQVCSEEISIVAGGDRIHHVPSLVNALLIPDMPVATWWIGDLPPADDSYTCALLDTADRLIVDSLAFDSVDDLNLVSSISEGTDSVPADLNWGRTEDWRIATASMFDDPASRGRLGDVERVRLAGTAGTGTFGERVSGLLYAGWLAHAVGNPDLPFEFRAAAHEGTPGFIAHVEIDLRGGGKVVLEWHRDGAAIVGRAQDIGQAMPTVTRFAVRDTVDLIIRQLSRQDEDPLFGRILPFAARLAVRN